MMRKAMRISRNQEGQALPITIGALALVMLVVTPFLVQAGTGLIGAGIYSQATNEVYAADAGVEHAVWNLNYGGLGETLQDVGDSASYQLGETLNGLTTTVTVTVDSTSGGSAGGAITDAVLDAMQYGFGGGEFPEIIRVGDGVYAVVYTDSRSDGWMMTAEISAGGNIGDAPLDAWEYDTKQGRWADIVHVTGDVYAIVYQGSGNDGFVKTMQIAASGEIKHAAIATLEFEKKSCVYPEIIHVAGDIFAIVYCGPGSDGFVKTVQIAADGSIDSKVIDSLEYDTKRGSEPSIINVLGDTYAIAYSGNKTDGYVVTLDITEKGEISKLIDSYEFNSDECQFPDIVNVFSDVYAIAYSGSSPANGTWWGGIISTVSIAADGTINHAVIDETAFDLNGSEYCDLLRVAGDTFAVCYTDALERGVVSTLSIDSAGQLGSAVIDTLVFDAVLGYYPRIIAVSGDVFAIAHTGADWYGALKTLGISTTSQPISADYEIVAVAGDNTITALVNISGQDVTILSWK